MLPVVAVRFAICAEETEAMLALKPAVVAVAGTVTNGGMTTELLLLANATLIPPVGAEPVSVTVQESLSAPVIDVLPQAIELTVGVTAVPAPLRAIETAGALL